MERGLAIIERDEVETRAVFIDQDVLECAKLNALTKKHLKEMDEAEKARERNRRRIEKEKARRKAYNRDSAVYVTMRLGTVGAVAWACTAGMISPAICVPVGLFCLCTACLRLGAWFGKH